MKKEKLINMCHAGVFTAIVFVTTAYLHIPVHTGYVHIGDGFIYLAASLLPMPYALFTGAAGALLADCLTGYALFAPASVIIKGLTVLFFTSKNDNLLNKRNLIALIPAAILCVGGYYLYEAVITGNFAAPLAGVTGNIIQSVFSSIVFIAAASAMKKMKIKLP